MGNEPAKPIVASEVPDSVTHQDVPDVSLTYDSCKLRVVCLFACTKLKTCKMMLDSCEMMDDIGVNTTVLICAL